MTAGVYKGENVAENPRTVLREISNTGPCCLNLTPFLAFDGDQWGESALIFRRRSWCPAVEAENTPWSKRCGGASHCGIQRTVSKTHDSRDTTPTETRPPPHCSLCPISDIIGPGCLIAKAKQLSSIIANQQCLERGSDAENARDATAEIAEIASIVSER